MNQTNLINHPSPSELLIRWHALTANAPGLRARDAATQLGVSEAELVGARCGDRVVRLAGPWGPLLQKLPDLGEVMVLTRNDHIVHEKIGIFTNIQIFQEMGLVLGDDIDLRVFLNHWKIGFAVTDATADGDRQSLQFFDSDGTAVHKIFLRDPSAVALFSQIIKDHQHPDQSSRQSVSPLTQPPADQPDEAIDQQGLRQDWLALNDVHDFHDLLLKHGVGRVQALRLVGEDLALPLSNDAFQLALHRATAGAVPIMIFVGNPGVIQIHTGPIENLQQTGSWFNVIDPSFNLHLREEDIQSAWRVRKPTSDGWVTSLEIYNQDGEQIALMFGARKPGAEERQEWRQLLAEISETAGLKAC